MLKIAITGAHGFLGEHMRIFLSTKDNVTVVPLGREDFADSTALAFKLKDCDVVYHFAGVNRASDDEIRDGNPALADTVVNALSGASSTAHVYYSSSVHEANDTIYGTSKREAGDHLKNWASHNNARFTRLILPHLFGEGGRPDYNSAIATFCHKLASGEDVEVERDAEIQPIHAQRLCELIWEDTISNHDQTIRDLKVDGTPIRVSELLGKLKGMAGSYHSNIFPDLRNTFDLDLFNTYRSYLYPQLYPVQLTKHTDQRGWLVETVKERNGGQVFFSTTKPGITRGNHFHRHKVERFLVVSGKADINIRKIGSDNVQTFSVDGDRPSCVDIPTLHTHNITNTGEAELLTLFWVHEIFDPENTDTYPVNV